jgi:L-ribulokinase
VNVEKYVIGLDYGTDSARCLIVDCSNGREAASAVHHYSRWADGKFCDPLTNSFRQHPLDYIEALERSVKSALKIAGKADSVKIAIMTLAIAPNVCGQQGLFSGGAF